MFFRLVYTPPSTIYEMYVITGYRGATIERSPRYDFHDLGLSLFPCIDGQTFRRLPALPADSDGHSPPHCALP